MSPGRHGISVQPSLLRPVTQPLGRIPFLGCVTLNQPYASAIFDADGPAWQKDVENRATPILRVPPGGALLGIHAGDKLYRPFRAPRFNLGGDAAREWGERVGDFRRLWPRCPDFDELPTSVILGLVVVLDPESPEAIAQIERSRWRMGPVCYALGDRLKLTDPIEASGMLGCWDPVVLGRGLTPRMVRDLEAAAETLRVQIGRA